MQIRSSLLRIAAVALLIYALAMFSASARETMRAEAELTRMNARLEQTRLENTALRAKLKAAESSETIERLARERLGLVLPGERVFYFTMGDSGDTTENSIPGTVPEDDGEDA